MSMNDPVRVKLSEADLAERAVQLATKVKHVEYLRKKKSDDAKSTQALIDSELDAIGAMSRVILEAEDDARQGDLFADGTLGQVAQGIADRCTCEGGPEAEAKDPGCPMHGVERREDGTAKDASERASDHEQSKANPDECVYCHETWPCEGSRSADEEPIAEQLESGLEAPPVGEPVDVGTVEEPASIAEHRANRARARRAQASGGAEGGAA